VPFVAKLKPGDVVCVAGSCQNRGERLRWSYEGRHYEQTVWVYARRAAGGHRDHCDPDGCHDAVFLEEKNDVGGWNWGAWNLERERDRWWDPIVVRHGQLSVPAFSDGHAIKHKWKQKSTLEMTDVPYPDCIRWPVTDGTDDLEFMRRGCNPAH
jgi:hypothetical protein